MALSTKRPAREAAREAAKLNEGAKRFGAELPESIYRAVQLKLAERGITARKYLLELLAKDGIR